MKCENCGGYDVSISPKTPGGFWVMVSLACTVAVLVVLIVVPIACAYPFFQRYIVAGLTIGSVKG